MSNGNPLDYSNSPPNPSTVATTLTANTLVLLWEPGWNTPVQATLGTIREGLTNGRYSPKAVVQISPSQPWIPVLDALRGVPNPADVVEKAEREGCLSELFGFLIFGDEESGCFGGCISRIIFVVLVVGAIVYAIRHC